MPLEQVREFDVAVIGGGTAGISAAVACARQGLSVCLIEGESFLGGMATGAQVGSICGLYLCSEKEEPIPVCGGFAQEFTARLKTISSNWRHHRYGKLHYLIYDVETFKKNCASFLYDVGVHCFLKSRAHSPVSEATQIKSISIQGHNNLSVLARTFIDCSGESRIVEELSHPILNPHEKRQAVSLVFAVEKMEFSDERQVALSFLRELSRFMDYSLSSYSLSHLRVALLPGSYCDHRAWFKLSFCCDDSQNNWLKKSEAAARSVLLEFFEFAKRQLSGLSHAKLNHIAPKLGVRTGPRPLGKIILRRDDILSKKNEPMPLLAPHGPLSFGEWKINHGSNFWKMRVFTKSQQAV